MIKERVRRLLDRENGPALLLSAQGKVLFLNTSATQYIRNLSIESGDSIYTILSRDTQAGFEKYLHQSALLKSSVQHFRGIIEVDYIQFPVEFWLTQTPTSQEDVFILLLEPMERAGFVEHSRELYKAVADCSIDIVSVYDSDYNCDYVSPSAYHQLSHPLVSYYTNLGFLQFIEPSARQTVLLEIEKDTREKKQFSKYSYLARKNNGELIKITNYITRIFAENKKLYRIVANERISFVETNTLIPNETQEELIIADAYYSIQYISQDARAILDVSNNDSSSLFLFIHPDDHPKLLVSKTQADSSVSTATQLRVLQAHQSFHLIDATIHHFFNALGQMVYMAIRWPSSKSKTETVSPPLVGNSDLQGTVSMFIKDDLSINYTSPSVKSILGYDVKELQDQKIVELIHQDYQSVVQEKLKLSFTQYVPNITSLIKKKDDTYQLVNVAFKTIKEDSGFSALFITLRAMNSSDPKLFQIVLDYLPDTVFLLKSSDFSVVAANSSAVSLLQQDRSELIGKEFFSMWEENVNEQLRAFLNQEPNLTSKDIQYTTAIGRTFWGNTSIKPMIGGLLPNEDLILLRIVDITDRKQQEEEQKASSSQESDSPRENFLSQISHEIRTPLNAVLGMTHLMLQSNPREDQKKMLQTLKFSGDNLTSLINDILDLSKIEAGQLRLENKEFNLLEFIQGIKLTYKSLVNDRGVLLRLLIEDEVPAFVMGDVNRLGQILNNLLNNAIKFTEKEQIVLSVYVEKEEEEKYILLFEVMDTGIGIPENKLSVIFEPYQQAGPSKYGGTGLGLSIVKNIVELQGGKISVQSTEGEGTTFRVALPLGKSEQVGNKKRETTQSFMAEFQSLEGLKVLYVEDVIPNQLLMEGLSDKWDVKLDTALNGLEGLQKIKDNHYDLILMDIQMPEMDGYEATREIRSLKDPHYENIPIIALTASVSEKTRQKIQEMGMDDYISKPIDPKDLHQKLAELSRKRATSSLSVSPADNQMGETIRADFSQLRELYQGDPEGYLEILEQIQRLTLECFPVIINSLKRKDEETLRFNCHKIMSYIRLLRLNLLEILLNQAKENVSNSQESASAANIVQQLTRQFDKLEQHIANEITTQQ